MLWFRLSHGTRSIEREVCANDPDGKPSWHNRDSESYFSSLVGNAASSCFGVVGMANSNARQGIRSFFNRRRSFPDQGVAVRKEGDGLAIDLHIIVTYGLNISAIVKKHRQ